MGLASEPSTWDDAGQGKQGAEVTRVDPAVAGGIRLHFWPRVLGIGPRGGQAELADAL